MLIYTQDGRLLRMGDGELKTTADDKRLLLIGEDETEIVLGRYKTFERRVGVFAELYAAKNSGQSSFTMPRE